MSFAANPILVGALVALSKGATLTEIKEDSIGYPKNYPGDGDFEAGWDAAQELPDFDGLREQFNDTIDAAIQKEQDA
ncbi:MAG: hypothetical protein ABWX92_04395 [Mycetocola sp.]